MFLPAGGSKCRSRGVLAARPASQGRSSAERPPTARCAVGVETIAAALSEPRDAIEEIIEPYLIQLGFVQRTPRGRLLTPHAFKHLGLAEPPREPVQTILFDDD